MAIFVCSFWLCDSVFAQAQSGVVISQIYGAGGNSGAIYRNDFIELFNRGSSTVDLKGWAVHYSSSTGSNWQKTELSGSIAPGKRMLIQQASGGANGAVLPVADITGSISLASTAGKVVLTSAATSIAAGTVCPSGPAVVDLVGYGTNANCFEGSGPAPRQAVRMRSCEVATAVLTSITTHRISLPARRSLAIHHCLRLNAARPERSLKSFRQKSSMMTRTVARSPAKY
ncbi:MAG: lamin tail domain-containing protein [Acidobacteria bacterium]|nr:lamin tail domain-containing protein [Acidobacteriota bacterium]